VKKLRRKALSVLELPTPAAYSAQWDCVAAGVDNSEGVFNFKKRERTNHLNLLGAVGKNLPLPARMLSIPAKK
jgi:hypothetical protein